MKLKTMKTVAMTLAVTMIAGLCVGCGAKKEETAEKKTEIQVFIAASMKSSLEELKESYEKEHPNVTVTLHADSSGTLLTQIQEGYACDIFFSAATKQMDELDAGGMLVDDTKKNMLNNQVVLVKAKGEKTEVTSLENINKAKSLALAASSVPVGKYTREAFKSLGILDKDADASLVTSKEVSTALNGPEVSEQANVSKVLLAVAEGSCEVGTVYLSDTFGYEDKVEIIEKVSNKLTGDVIYPLARVQNKEADENQEKAAQEFYEYLSGDEAQKVYEEHLFEVIK